MYKTKHPPQASHGNLCDSEHLEPGFFEWTEIVADSSAAIIDNSIKLLLKPELLFVDGTVKGE